MSKNDARQVRRSQISRQLLLQYVISLLVFLAGFATLILLGWTIGGNTTWYGTEFLYPLLKWVREYVLLWGGGVILAGWMIITYRFLARPLRFLDEVVLASAQLAQPSDAPIALPEAMKNAQDELNLVREQALRNAMAAKEAEQRKNDLVVYLAHDLKTPLTSVLGYLTLLRDEPQISQALRAKYTGVALGKAERLEELINEFFEITRFSLTHLSLEPERVNLTRMLEQLLYESGPILAEKNLSVQAQLSPDVVIRCDANKLSRVFDNLIHNAVSYGEPDTEISVTLLPGVENIEICVENHGKTIPAEKLERIFEQFFRLDASRGTSSGGAGLGLAIAKEIVELHGGTIHADSADGRIRFHARLPVDCQKNVRNS